MFQFPHSADTFFGRIVTHPIFLWAVVASCCLVSLVLPAARAEIAVGSLSADGLSQAELEEQRNKWLGQGVRHYIFRFQRTCFCLPDWVEPGTVNVIGGQIESVISDNTGETLDPSLFLSVDDLFDALQDALDQPADLISAEFDKSLGYPSNIFIDFIKLAADEEKWYAATDLHTHSMIPGDADFNGIVNFVDFVVLANNFNVTGTDWQHGNFDLDGVTNFKDFTILSNHFGKVAPFGYSVPEPGAVALVSCVIMVVPLILRVAQVDRSGAKANPPS